MKYRHDIKDVSTGETRSLEITLSQEVIDKIELSRATQSQENADETARVLVELEIARSRDIPDGFVPVGRPLLMGS
jgi:hypothetical protein